MITDCSQSPECLFYYIIKLKLRSAEVSEHRADKERR